MGIWLLRQLQSGNDVALRPILGLSVEQAGAGVTPAVRTYREHIARVRCSSRQKGIGALIDDLALAVRVRIHQALPAPGTSPAVREVTDVGTCRCGPAVLSTMVTFDGFGGERLVILRFPGIDAARRWYSSDLYAEALAAAAGGLRRRLFIVEGL